MVYTSCNTMPRLSVTKIVSAWCIHTMTLNSITECHTRFNSKLDVIDHISPECGIKVISILGRSFSSMGSTPDIKSLFPFN